MFQGIPICADMATTDQLDELVWCTVPEVRTSRASARSGAACDSPVFGSGAFSLAALHAGVPELFLGGASPLPGPLACQNPETHQVPYVAGCSWPPPTHPPPPAHPPARPVQSSSNPSLAVRTGMRHFAWEVPGQYPGPPGASLPVRIAECRGFVVAATQDRQVWTYNPLAAEWKVRGGELAGKQGGEGYREWRRLGQGRCFTAGGAGRSCLPCALFSSVVSEHAQRQPARGAGQISSSPTTTTTTTPALHLSALQELPLLACDVGCDSEGLLWYAAPATNATGAGGCVGRLHYYDPLAEEGVEVPLRWVDMDPATATNGSAPSSSGSGGGNGTWEARVHRVGAGRHNRTTGVVEVALVLGSGAVLRGEVETELGKHSRAQHSPAEGGRVQAGSDVPCSGLWSAAPSGGAGGGAVLLCCNFVRAE